MWLKRVGTIAPTNKYRPGEALLRYAQPSWLNAESDRPGRVGVQKDLTLPGHSEIFVVGDTARFEENGKPLPGVAQVAMQQGRYAGRLIARRIEGKPEPGRATKKRN